MAPRSSGRVGTLLLCDPAWFEPRLEVEPRAHGARLSIHAVAVVAGGQAWAGCRGDSVGQEAMKVRWPSLGQEDRSAPVRVCCVRSVCLLDRERVIALLALDLLALVLQRQERSSQTRNHGTTPPYGLSITHIFSGALPLVNLGQFCDLANPHQDSFGNGAHDLTQYCLGPSSGFGG